MPLTPSEIAGLRVIARLATKGPWHERHHPRQKSLVGNRRYESDPITFEPKVVCVECDLEDGIFIATFNPELILRLLDEVEKGVKE
jgi:hypothetical protein